MILFPPCKINLGLSVKYKREDGFHELESIMYQLPWCDILEIVKSDEFNFTSTGLEILGETENNLCIKAYRLLQQDFQLTPVKIHLHKILPMGAGLGGGSSDGAYTLRMLNELFELNLTTNQLRSYANQLGSDCALFIEDLPQLAKGRGEILKNIDLDLSGYYVHLINIGIHINTKMAFENLSFKQQHFSLENLKVSDMHNWKNYLFNDFENSIFPSYPELAEIKARMYENGAFYASMTGSGSTMFGIYKKEPKVLNFSGKEEYLEKIISL